MMFFVLDMHKWVLWVGKVAGLNWLMGLEGQGKPEAPDTWL